MTQLQSSLVSRLYKEIPTKSNVYLDLQQEKRTKNAQCTWTGRGRKDSVTSKWGLQPRKQTVSLWSPWCPTFRSAAIQWCYQSPEASIIQHFYNSGSHLCASTSITVKLEIMFNYLTGWTWLYPYFNWSVSTCKASLSCRLLSSPYYICDKLLCISCILANAPWSVNNDLKKLPRVTNSLKKSCLNLCSLAWKYSSNWEIETKRKI